LRRLDNWATVLLSSFQLRRLMPLIYLFAGEQSGDVLGAALMQAIRARRPDATFIGGSAMAEAHGPGDQLHDRGDPVGPDACQTR
jgi:hypothetical protein